MVTGSNAIDYLMAHWQLGVIVLAICLTISLCLIARLWVTHWGDPVISKLVWSAVLLLPVLGWLFFAAFHHAVAATAHGGHVEYGQAAHSGDAGGGGSGHH